MAVAVSVFPAQEKPTPANLGLQATCVVKARPIGRFGASTVTHGLRGGRDEGARKEAGLPSKAADDCDRYQAPIFGIVLAKSVICDKLCENAHGHTVALSFLRLVRLRISASL